MIKNHLIIIPFNIPFNWSTDYTNQTAKILSQSNHVICFLWQDSLSLKQHFKKNIRIKLITKQKSHLYHFNPIHLIPFRRFNLVSRINFLINQYLLKIFAYYLTYKDQLKGEIIWAFDSQFLSLVKAFNNKYISIYDCLDYSTKKDEKNFIKLVDLMTVNSKTLYKLHQNKRRQLNIVPQGFRLKDFKSTKNKNQVKFKKPTIGYIGGINDRLDFSLLLPLIKNNPQWNFVFWGPKQSNLFSKKPIKSQLSQLFSLPNVTNGSSKDKKEIPSIVSQFDIGIIPFDTSQSFNLYCFPMKVFEYFYLGKPVISTSIKELHQFKKFVKLSNSAETWENHIKKILKKPWPQPFKHQQRKIAIANSWQNKLEIISLLISK